MQTLPSAVKALKRQGTDSTLNADEDVASSLPTDVGPPPLRALATKRIITILINYAFLAWTEQACSVLVALIYPTPISYGGLGLSTFAVGIIMSCLGVLIGLSSVFIFPRAIARYGAVKLYRTCYAGYLINPILFPLMNFVARRRGVDAPVWIMIGMQVMTSTLSCQCFGEWWLFL